MSKEKHLELIQAVITRMAGNSFLLKGWSVFLVSALFVLAARDANPYFLYLAYFPIFAFWTLDGYFLWQERMHRKLYDAVRLGNGDHADFSMDANEYKNQVGSWLSTCFSTTIFIFHGTIALVVVLVMLLLSK